MIILGVFIMIIALVIKIISIMITPVERPVKKKIIKRKKPVVQTGNFGFDPATKMVIQANIENDKHHVFDIYSN